MTESCIVKTPPEAEWGKPWDTEHDMAWESLVDFYSDKRPVWLFAKGPSFNPSFNWQKAWALMNSMPFAVSQACMHIPIKSIMITADYSIWKLIPDEYKRWSICGVRGTNWPQAAGSGNLALAILGALGVKDIITVGMDNALGTYGEVYGHEYNGPVHKFSDTQNQRDCAGLNKSKDEIISLYKLNVKKFEGIE